jgi:pimeloyl-ACP methyl ester carboxylesterase
MNTVNSSDGTTIAFDRTGDGPPIIVVDGAFSHRAINPTSPKLAALLAPRFSVYTYDRRGRGESGDTKPYAVAREVEDLEALIAQAGGAADVFGGSSGAMLALDAAAQGAAITRLALYEPPFVVDDSRPPLPADYQSRLQALLAADRRGDAVALFFTEAMLMPRDAVDQMRSGPFWAELEKVAPTLAYEGALFGDTMSGKPLSSERWGSVAVPTLVIDGGASPAFMHNGADALAGLLPNAQRRTLEGQTHDVAAEALAPVLVDLFRGEQAAAA